MKQHICLYIKIALYMYIALISGRTMKSLKIQCGYVLVHVYVYIRFGGDLVVKWQLRVRVCCNLNHRGTNLKVYHLYCVILTSWVLLLVFALCMRVVSLPELHHDECGSHS